MAFLRTLGRRCGWRCRRGPCARLSGVVALTPMGAAFWFRCLLRLRRPVLPRRCIRLGGLLLGVRLLIALRGRLPWRSRHQRLLVHVDDRVVGAPGRLFGPHRRDPVDPLAGALVLAVPFAVAAHGLAFTLQRRTLAELGVEQDLQVGAQRGQLGPQLRHLIGGLRAQLGGQLSAQLGFDGELIFAARGDLPVQLQVVDQLQVPRPGLIHVALPAVDHRDERRNHGGPQSEDHGKLEELHLAGENQRRTGTDRQDQQRGQQHPTRSAAAAPHPGAAGQIGHGPNVPARGHSACRRAPAFLTWTNRPSRPELTFGALTVLGRIPWRFTAVLQPQPSNHQSQRADGRDRRPDGVFARHPEP